MPLKYLRNLGRTLEMTPIDCEINLISTWFENCVISSANGKRKIAITDTNLYVLVTNLSDQHNKLILLVI